MATTVTPGLEELLDPARVPAAPREDEGYLDLLGEGEDPTGGLFSQRLMASDLLPKIYERIWRPLGGKLLMGVIGPDMQDERRIALNMLRLEEGDRVLDVACGPGNFSRGFARAVGDEGLVVGLDASRTMLEAGVREGNPDNVAYVRGDASALPFRDESFDAVCCFAALYLIEKPFAALDEIARVLKPGGRVALLSSCSRGPVPAGVTNALTRPLTGVRIFGRDELTEPLRTLGFTDLDQRLAGLAQFVSARKS